MRGVGIGLIDGVADLGAPGSSCVGVGGGIFRNTGLSRVEDPASGRYLQAARAHAFDMMVLVLRSRARARYGRRRRPGCRAGVVCRRERAITRSARLLPLAENRATWKPRIAALDQFDTLFSFKVRRDRLRTRDTVDPRIEHHGDLVRRGVRLAVTEGRRRFQERRIECHRCRGGGRPGGGECGNRRAPAVARLFLPSWALAWGLGRPPSAASRKKRKPRSQRNPSNVHN